MNNYDFIGFSVNDGNPTCSIMGGESKNEIMLDWYVKQDHVFECVNGEWEQLSKEEFVRRYDKHIEENSKRALRMLEAKVKTLTEEIEKYNNFKHEFLK